MFKYRWNLSYLFLYTSPLSPLFLLRRPSSPQGAIDLVAQKPPALLFATMGLTLPSFPYPPSKEGYWEPISSTINWCEEDYYATQYSAEIVNTLTNLLFIALGVKGIRNCLKYDHDNVFLVAFIGYVAVGSGSFLFHSTLKCKDSIMPVENIYWSFQTLCSLSTN